MVLLGADDVVVMQKLTNPVPTGNGQDTEANVPSDLPYACSAPWSDDAAKFVGPNRIVSRMPTKWDEAAE